MHAYVRDRARMIVDADQLLWDLFCLAFRTIVHWRAMSVAFFAFGRGLCSSLRLLSWLGVLKARCAAVPAANATVTSQIGQRRA